MGLPEMAKKNGLAGNAKYGLAGNENVPWYTPNAKACSDKCLCNCICVCIFICERNSPAAAKNKGKEPKRTKKTRKRKRMGKEQSHPTRTFPSLLHSPTSAFSDAYIFLSTSLTRGQHHIPVEPLTDCCALIRDAVLEYLSLSLLPLTWNKIAHKETTQAYNPLPEKKEVVRLRQQINQISPLTNTFLSPTHRIPTPQASYSSRSYQLS